jgi:hypothetical protein
VSPLDGVNGVPTNLRFLIRTDQRLAVKSIGAAAIRTANFAQGASKTKKSRSRGARPSTKGLRATAQHIARHHPAKFDARLATSPEPKLPQQNVLELSNLAYDKQPRQKPIRGDPKRTKECGPKQDRRYMQAGQPLHGKGTCHQAQASGNRRRQRQT